MTDIAQHSTEARREQSDRRVTAAIMGIIFALMLAFGLAPNLFLSMLSG